MEKNLQDKEALEKFQKLVKDVGTCMLITNNTSEDGLDHTRPMYTIDVEENGTLWFFTDIRSLKVEEISKDHSVHLVYAHPGKESYLDVWGTASVTRDKAVIKEKWSAIAKAWFPGGVDDPNISLLKVHPNKMYYWDAEAGKMVSFLRIIAAAVTGKPALGEDAQGSLKI